MAAIDRLVTSDWLSHHLGDPDLRIVDATIQISPTFQITSGRRDWEHAHIPGAVYADLIALSDPDAPPYLFHMPPVDHFAAGMARLGIGDGTRVVLYDARENMWAARLWWMLRTFGFDDAAILDGGWTTWQLERRRTCSIPCAYAPATFTPHARPGLIADKHDVLAALHDPSVQIVCALGHRSYAGEINEYGRPGHIPGAANVSAWSLIDRATQRYRPLAELRARFADVLGARRVITYCGAGMAASSDAFVLHLLGHHDVAVYMSGLLEWCADRELPMERSVGEGAPISA